LIEAKAQDQRHSTVTVEMQAYPTGLIPGLRITRSLSDQSAILVRLGYNWFRHRDLGVHDDERGGGFGGTIGYQRYFKSGHERWHLTLKTDIWWNNADWYDIGPTDERIEGETSITVLQPTLELGYTIFKDTGLVITPSIAFGYEWNVRTVGEPTGQGAIILVGIQIGKRF